MKNFNHCGGEIAMMMDNLPLAAFFLIDVRYTNLISDLLPGNRDTSVLDANFISHIPDYPDQLIL